MHRGYDGFVGRGIVRGHGSPCTILSWKERTSVLFKLLRYVNFWKCVVMHRKAFRVGGYRDQGDAILCVEGPSLQRCYLDHID